ncbi:hypothetical protein SARC_02104 [Sphaeroforma arctica JP610]|uniref:Derlin n=1 Tax=Sphaeroforma arctica JP610 TaxID=667725 RepID=A0A0L0G9Q1_9EUKA|nr:hypothetical protein SARC_02104 [Sphaeroforma arctica JP610]KNC85730.1 hypothetical protein SARC_02104 [Sphaeroforma arctica JP610]|eukprot:XP_014159632.1 hypothetical protein SARC_02104 [Sphaeroforma arctica JP610]
MFFLVRYCRLLEEGSFRGRPADFFFMLLFGAFQIILIAPLTNVFFLGYALTFMLVYVWGRRNLHARMSFLGIFTFTAPYLPWVLLGFSLMLGHSPVIDLMGMGVGHVYYYLEDFYPALSGRRLLKTPQVIKMIFEDQPMVIIPEDQLIPDAPRPGGFDWGRPTGQQNSAGGVDTIQEIPNTSTTNGSSSSHSNADANAAASVSDGGLRQRNVPKDGVSGENDTRNLSNDPAPSDASIQESRKDD